MKYSDGSKIKIGDRVKLWDGRYGTVVCSIDTNEFTSDFPKENWDYLKSGILIEMDRGELFHYPELDEDFEPVRSGGTS